MGRAVVAYCVLAGTKGMDYGSFSIQLDSARYTRRALYVHIFCMTVLFSFLWGPDESGEHGPQRIYIQAVTDQVICG